MRTADYILAAAGWLGHLTLVVILLRRRLVPRVSVFATVMVFYMVRSALFLLPQFSVAWPGLYWALIYLDPGLQILLMVVLVVRRPGSDGSWNGSWFVGMTAAVALAAAAAWQMGTSSHYSPQHLALKLSMFVSFLWLLAGGLVLRRRDGVGFSTGIVVGFAVYSAANIGAELMRMHFALFGHVRLYTELSYFLAIVYLCCLAGWSILFSRASALPDKRVGSGSAGQPLADCLTSGAAPLVHAEGIRAPKQDRSRSAYPTSQRRDVGHPSLCCPDGFRGRT